MQTLEPFVATELGFRRIQALPDVTSLSPSVPLISRASAPDLDELNRTFEAIKRGEGPEDVTALLGSIIGQLSGMGRAITSFTPNLPIRENLEAEVQQLLPTETPVRNMIPRVPGSGSAVSWRQIVTFGGGWGSGTDQLGGGAVGRIFFGETGAPQEFTSQYLNKTARYKLMGVEGSVTGFGMAVGANFQNQYAVERTASMINLMLNEENALINGDSTSTAAPWGDGTNALAFDGLLNLCTTANGVPSANIQTSVGSLTFAHLDNQLRRIWNAGGTGLYMIMNAQEALSVTHLAEATGTMHRIQTTGSNNRATAGLYIDGYVHPLSGEIVRIIISRFMPAGTIFFGAEKGPKGLRTLEVEVLPQVQLPQLAPNSNVQGYVAQEIAPTRDSPQVFPWLISVYQVLKMKNALIFAKSTGVTAV